MFSIAYMSEFESQGGMCTKKSFVPKIAGHRRGEHSDLPALSRLMCIKTYDIFGGIEIGRIYESSCITVVQYNEKGEITSGICLCNYPNVPSIPTQEWLHWLKIHYGIENIVENIMERGTMFVHCLLWDDRYADVFLKHLLSALFDMDVYSSLVILVLPPRVTPEDAFACEMSRILPVGFEDTFMVQALYITTRYKFFPKLRIRRAVEEDNDDIIPIIDADSSFVKEVYGEYYISEMIRHPDGCRQLIVSEDSNSFVTGTMCLSTTIDVDLLNENFELTVYNGLRKVCETDQSHEELEEIISEILSMTFVISSEAVVDSKDKQHSGILKTIQDDEEDTRTDLTSEDDDTRKISLRSVQFVDSSHVRSDTDSQSKDVEIEEIYRRQESVSKEGKRVRISEVVHKDDDESRNIVEREPRENIEIRSSLRKTNLKKETSRREETEDEENSVKVLRNSELSQIPNDGLTDVNNSSAYTAFVDTIVQIPRIQTMSMTKPVEPEPADGMQKISIYRGEVNAFVVELFTMREDIGNHGAFEFLEAAFELFPDLDYCAILVPSAYSYFSLLEHFTRVPLRSNKDFPMSLYLAHRAVLFGKIIARRADRSDTTAVEEFLNYSMKKNEIMRYFNWAVNQSSNNFFSFVFESDDVVIGIAIVCINESNEEIRRHYHVEDFISNQYVRHDSYGRLLHFVLMPIFSVHQKFFFCEIMRLSDVTVLYYRLHEEEENSHIEPQPIISCLHAMVPVNPRRWRKFKCCMNLGGYQPKKKCNKETWDKVFSLFVTTPRIAMIPYRNIDTKIIVVGASNCGLAFLEFLTFGYPQNFIHFTDLTLIAPNGLPYQKKCDNLKWDMIPFKGRYCHDYRRRLIVGHAWVNVVNGMVVEINRIDKYVTVMNQGTLSYDFLILTCGLQYQKTLFREKKIEIQERRDVKSEIISNCLTINDHLEASVSLEKIQSLTSNFTEKKSIIFYGHSISCYCALHGLMKHGVNGSWITLIEPKLNRCETHDAIFFHNCEVDITIMNAIVENEVNILSGWNLIDWNLQDSGMDEKIIQSIVIRSGTTIKTVPCDIFYNFHEKEIDINTFLAICRAGLVFDYQLVINPEFCTNDPFVFAAGNITKYARKYHGESFEHKYYDSVDVGERFGKFMREVVEAYQENKGKWKGLDKSKSSIVLPNFRSPIIVSCILPGDYHYLHVEKPGKKITGDVVGNVMVTGTCSSEIGYFRLHLNEHNTVESITCCSKKNFEVHDIITLYGKHDSMLNELKYRFEKSLISDFFAYFQEPWALALFCDRFECLRVENRAILMSKLNCHADSLLEDCVHALSKTEGEGISKEDRELIAKKFVGSVYQQMIEKNVVDFLQFSDQDLPVYCTPRLMRWLYDDIKSSPLFFNQ